MSASYVTKALLAALAAKLSNQDYALIKSVSDLRFVTSSQLIRLHFASHPNTRAARRVLLRLTRLGVLERLPRVVGASRSGGSDAFIYRLAPAGQRLGMERGWQPSGRIRRAQVPGSLFIGHALQVAELHTLLVEAEYAGWIELLELAAEPGCWRSYGQRTTLKPDSYVRLGIGDYEDSYMVEVDMGTEGSRALLRKLRQYTEYAATGREQAECGVFPKVLWLVPDARRAGVVEDCIARLPHSAQRLFATAPFTNAMQVITEAENG
ncbi:MAG: replication-relaxation family protein [Mycobacteriales bacterium]